MADTSNGSGGQSDAEAYRLLLGELDSNQRLAIENARLHIYHAAYYELCETITGKAPSDEPPDEEEFKQQVLEYLKNRRDEFHKKICVDLKWCEQRRKFGTAMVPVPWLMWVIGFLIDVKTFGHPHLPDVFQDWGAESGFGDDLGLQ